MSFDLALKVAKHFRLSATDAETVLTQIRTAVSSWREVAVECRIRRAEQDHMAAAFDEQ